MERVQETCSDERSKLTGEDTDPLKKEWMKKQSRLTVDQIIQDSQSTSGLKIKEVDEKRNTMYVEKNNK